MRLLFPSGVTASSSDIERNPNTLAQTLSETCFPNRFRQQPTGWTLENVAWQQLANVDGSDGGGGGAFAAWLRHQNVSPLRRRRGALAVAPLVGFCENNWWTSASHFGHAPPPRLSTGLPLEKPNEPNETPGLRRHHSNLSIS